MTVTNLHPDRIDDLGVRGGVVASLVDDLDAPLVSAGSGEPFRTRVVIGLHAGFDRIRTGLRADLAQLLDRRRHGRPNGVVGQIGDDLQGGQQGPRLVRCQTHGTRQGVGIGDRDGAVGVDGIHVDVDEIVRHAAGQSDHPQDLEIRDHPVGGHSENPSDLGNSDSGMGTQIRDEREQSGGVSTGGHEASSSNRRTA